MSFASVYPLYVSKAEKKERKKAIFELTSLTTPNIWRQQKEQEIERRNSAPNSACTNLYKYTHFEAKSND
jgi:hypothetical protein